jgi:inhibitor of cysteine peptidase
MFRTSVPHWKSKPCVGVQFLEAVSNSRQRAWKHGAVRKSAQGVTAMVYDERADGRTVEALVGEEFEIELPEAPTAGYLWKLESDAARPVCQLVAENFRPRLPGVGGRGVHHWRFRGVSPGTGEIQILYGRPWQNSTGPAKTFTLKVQVRP